MTYNPAVLPQSHPYYPLEAKVAGYVANELSIAALLVAFLSVVGFISTTSCVITRKINPRLPISEVITVMWFVLCGCLHIFFEGYFVVNFMHMGSRQGIGQLWKEYARSDSRYMTRNSLVLSLEIMTVMFWGPLSMLVAGMIVTNHPLRHPLQIIVSLAHFYGDVIYYATSTLDFTLDDIRYSRPEPQYFYGYYVFANAFWIIIPPILIYQSVASSGRAFQLMETAYKTLEASRTIKKQK